MSLPRWVLAVALGASAWSVAAESAPTRWQAEATQRTAALHGAVWFGHEPLAFLLRRGTDLSPAAIQQYWKQHEPDNIAQLAAGGVKDAGNLHFYKGFGLEAESAEMDRAVRAATVAHQHGMRVSIYIGGTMFVETFDRENPSAREWEARDGYNHPIPYTPLQTFRHYPSVYSTEYVAYLKRVLHRAVATVHPDEVFFDNTMLQPEPESDHSAGAVAAFHHFLHEHYPTGEQALARFGVADTDLLQAPEWDNPGAAAALKSVDDPVLQEWVRFRCESLAHYCNDLYDYVKALDPRIAVGFNLKGVFSFNRLWTNAVYHPLYQGHCDFITLDAGGFAPRLDRSGALVSQLRTYRMARTLGFSCVDDKLASDVDVACYMAFNLQNPIAGGKTVGGPEEMYASNVISPLFEFFRHYNDRFFTATAAVADVAVLRTWPSLAYSISADYVGLTLAEQVLMQHHIPFDLVFDERHGDLSRYPVVLLAGEEAMSDATVQWLLAYARQGGCIVADPACASLDEHRHRRAERPFAVARSEGRGRIVTLPAIVPGRPQGRVVDAEDNPEMTRTLGPTTQRLLPAQWILPQNHPALAETINSALGNARTLDTNVALTTLTEVQQRPATHETLVHFINFDTKANTGTFSVHVRPGFPAAANAVQLFVSEQNDPISLPFTTDGERISFKVPPLHVYGLVVIGPGSAAAGPKAASPR